MGYLYETVQSASLRRPDIITGILLGRHGEKSSVMAAAHRDIIEYELCCAAYSFELSNRETLDRDWVVFLRQSLKF